MTKIIDLITRRTMLGGMAAIAAPVSALAAAPDESITDRVERLSTELSEALNEYQDGNWHALVFPSAQTELPVTISRSPRTRMESVYWCLSALKSAIRNAYGFEARDHSKLREDCAVICMTLLPEDMGVVMGSTTDGRMVIAEYEL